ncbi:MAG: alpha/beta hydrolase [Bacteroidia bacterium]|nr:alpha/beta hydrolase [Bacteroidia bacterium]
MKSIFTFILLFICLSLHSQERYVSIDGQKFFIKEFGVGDITVIFENGMSDSLEAWGAIPDTVALFTHVFLYDRADIGKSDSSRQERTIPNMVLELKSILKHENINPPYILVGHSLGGYITRYFSSQFPDDVKGLLLLDPAPEAFWESMSKRKLKKYIEGGNEWYRTKHAPKYWKEWHQFILNMVYMKNLNISKNLPIILVSATESNWYKYHEKIIAGFKNARHVELAGGHYLHINHPDLIVGYIKELSSPTETTLIPRQ